MVCQDIETYEAGFFCTACQEAVGPYSTPGLKLRDSDRASPSELECSSLAHAQIGLLLLCAGWISEADRVC